MDASSRSSGGFCSVMMPMARLAGRTFVNSPSPGGRGGFAVLLRNDMESRWIQFRLVNWIIIIYDSFVHLELLVLLGTISSSMSISASFVLGQTFTHIYIYTCMHRFINRIEYMHYISNIFNWCISIVSMYVSRMITHTLSGFWPSKRVFC